MEFVIPLLALIISVVLHEVMHGYVGDRLGDPTPRMLGRLTLNPIRHLDPWMSVALPALLVLIGSPIIFGAAKPVPINPIHFKDPRKDMALVALAGPLTNFALAAAAIGIYKIIFTDISFTLSFIAQGATGSPLALLLLFLTSTITINLVLGFLNLIPIPPLDGSRILSAFLPEDIAASFDRLAPYGIFVLFALLIFPIGPFNLGNLLEFLLSTTLRLFGLL